jgi:hypothetical protein
MQFRLLAPINVYVSSFSPSVQFVLAAGKWLEASPRSFENSPANERYLTRLHKKRVIGTRLHS